jgi:hypothetical protein|tara:strand:+ start:842 stop:1003 length:162 start_codon:yes stop_codon:yes gene_type:complete
MKKQATKLDSSVQCRATASLSQEVEEDKKEEDKPLAQLLQEENSKDGKDQDKQ